MAEDTRVLECSFHRVSSPLLPSALPHPSNPLSLNGVAPLTFWGNVSIAVKFLSYCLLTFILANMDLIGSLIRVNGTLRIGCWDLVVSGTLELVEGGCQTLWVA